MPRESRSQACNSARSLSMYQPPVPIRASRCGWLGVVKGGRRIGSTDEVGLRALEPPVHVHDIHASILWSLGLDHLKTTFQHNGRAQRPTVLAGQVVQELFG